MMRYLVLLCLLMTATACVSYPPDSPPPGYDQSSPRQTMSYLQWAYENENPLHVSRCLSEDFMEGAAVSPSDIAVAWESARTFVTEQIGDVETVELGDVLAATPDGRFQVIRVRSNLRSADVTFVLESRFKIVPNSFKQDSIEGEFATMADIVSYEGNEAVIHLSGIQNPDDLPPDKIHKIFIESAWRIDAIEYSIAKKNGTTERIRSGSSNVPQRLRKVE